MKKIITAVLAGAMVISTYATSFAAVDTSDLISPVKTNFLFASAHGSLKVTNILNEENLSYDSHTFKTTVDTSSTFLNCNNTQIAYYTPGAQYPTVKRYPRNSFVWDFDFRVDNICTDTTSSKNTKAAFFVIGPETANNKTSLVGWTESERMIFFASKSSTTGEVSYGIRYADGSLAKDKRGISSTDPYYASLKLGQTYHMHISYNMYDGIIKTAFVNGNGVTINQTHRVKYERYSAGAARFNRATLYAAPTTTEDTTNSIDFRMSTYAPFDMTITNEKVYYEGLSVNEPSISLDYDNGNVKVSQAGKFNWAGTEGGEKFIYAPTNIMAVYDNEGRLISTQNQTSASGKLWSYSALTSNFTIPFGELSNGTYTIKSFMWDKLKPENGLGLRPIPGSYIEKTLTVGGTAEEPVIELN